MRDYTFDLCLSATVHVPAESYDEAMAFLSDRVNGVVANLWCTASGDPVDAEVYINGPVTKEMLVEVDGDPCCVCQGCGAIEGSADWGTVGDGFDGYCGSCADKREPVGEGGLASSADEDEGGAVRAAGWLI